MARTAIEEKKIEAARQCLALIRDIADRGASSWDPDQVGYAIQELSQVLFERPGTEEILFEPVSAGEIPDLAHLYEELAWIDGCSREMFRPH